MTDDTASSHAPSRHVTVWIAADSAAVYAVASDVAQLPRWAAGLTDPALAAAAVAFVAPNELGVLDHVVRLPSGEAVYNPMRVIPAGAGEPCCEVVFTVRRRAGITADQFDVDAAAVLVDLETLRDLLEREG